MRKYNWSKKRLMSVIDKAVNYCDALRLLGIPTQGNNLSTLKRKISEYNLDTSHFNGRQETYGKDNVGYKSVTQYINTNKYIKSSRLKEKLIIENYKENRCEICGLSEWNGRPLVLQLHHIDGNHNNNALDNLQILCPNCHSQTDNYCGSANAKIQKTCPDCGVPIHNKSNYCKKCATKHRYVNTSTIPSKEELMEMFIKTGSFTQIGKYYGVSDNAIRKWFQRYSLPTKSTVLRQSIKEKHPDIKWDNLKGNVECLRQHQKQQFKKIVEIDDGNNIIKIFYSRQELVDDGLTPNHVYDVCQGKLLTHCHRKFRYWELG